jgi:autotransporter-associated beta strand protein
MSGRFRAGAIRVRRAAPLLAAAAGLVCARSAVYAGASFSGSSTATLIFDPDTGGGTQSKTINAFPPPASSGMPVPTSYQLAQTFASGSASSTAKGSIGYVLNATTATFTLSSGTGVTQNDPSNVYTGDSLLRVNFNGIFNPTSPSFGPLALGYVSIAIGGTVGTGGHAQFIGQINFTNANTNTALRSQVNFNQLYTTAGNFAQAFTSSAPLGAGTVPVGTPVRVQGFFEFRASNLSGPSDMAPTDIEFGNAPPTATWYADSDGAWNNAANWAAPAGSVIDDPTGSIPAVPNGPGVRARFLNNLSAPRTIALPSAITLGAIDIASAQPLTIGAAGGPAVTLDTNTSDSAAIQVRNVHGNNDQTLSAPLVLAKSVDMNTDGTYQGYGMPKPVGNLALTEVVSGSGSINKRGEGTARLTTANTYTGGTVAAGGFLNANATGALGSGSVHAVDGGLGYNAAHASASGVAVVADENGQIDLGIHAGDDERFAIGDLGCISGGVDSIISLNAGVGGNLQLQPGAMIGHVGFFTDPTVGNPANLESSPIYIFGISADIPTNSAQNQIIVVGTNSASPWRGFGSDRLDRMFGSGTTSTVDQVVVSGTADLVSLHETLLLNAQLNTLTAGSITNKRGKGTVIVNNMTNNVNGPINVQTGTMLVNGTLTPQPQLSVNVASGATLGGKGTISGPVISLGGSFIAPGTNILGQYAGTLTVAELDLSPTSHLLFDLSNAGVVGSNVNDFIQINGSLVLDGVLDVSDLANFDSGDYTLMSWTGRLIDHGLDLGLVPNSDLSYNLSIVPDPSGIGASLVLNAQQVLPEPACGAVLAMATFLLSGGRKRQRRARVQGGMNLAPCVSVTR